MEDVYKFGRWTRTPNSGANILYLLYSENNGSCYNVYILLDVRAILDYLKQKTKKKK